MHLPFGSIDQASKRVECRTGATSHVEAGFTEQYIGKIAVCALAVEDGEEAVHMVLFADGRVAACAMLQGLRVAETKETIWQMDQLHADFGDLVIIYARLQDGEKQESVAGYGAGGVGLHELVDC